MVKVLAQNADISVSIVCCQIEVVAKKSINLNGTTVKAVRMSTVSARRYSRPNKMSIKRAFFEGRLRRIVVCVYVPLTTREGKEREKKKNETDFCPMH